MIINVNKNIYEHNGFMETFDGFEVYSTTNVLD